MKRMKMLLRLAIFLIAAFLVIRYFFVFQNEVDEKNGAYLNNNVVFGGIVNDLKISNNHRFGIITLNIAKHDLPVFNQVSPANSSILFPYKLQNGIAEVYDLVPSGLAVGDSVYLHSKERVIKYFYAKENKQFAGRLKMITSGLDIDFVNQNSKVK